KKVITNIEVNHNKLVVAEWGGITVEDMNGNAVVTKVNDFNYALLDVDGVIWFGSSQYGLLRIGINGEEGFLPNGPRAAASYNMLGTGKELWVASGSHTNTYAATYSYNRYYHFTGSEWKNAPDNPLINPMFDFTEIAQNPINKNIYFGTHGSGIVELANVSGQPIQTFDSTNSPLQNYGVATVVTGLAFDKTGRMWVSNFGADSALRVRLTNGKWVAFQLQTASAGKILIDAKNYKWLTSPRNISNGIIVYDDNGTPENKADDRIATLNNTPLGGNLPSLSISCMVQTGKGDIWIGSDLGLSVISTPSNVFLNPSNLANRIIIPFEEGSSQGAYLLGNEIINCITIDGGDRRWVGTNNGAYLIDNDGQTVLKHYTKDNSPLLSDQIYTIGIIEETGEVFFGTSRGIVSYQGNATKSSKNFNNLKIFPNPVKENFDGDVSISGLMNNSLVKITDINGNLIFETGSNGGTATWNCRKFNGERPATGVYLVFVINEDGSETSMGKILFIH
ncbi:MAG: T9SS type A sorting domain-containing protein, partial [Bacteroidia bacterium]|nr:T9SS type A sorting domain-containing protein [Bacteroidia bacterium]